MVAMLSYIMKRKIKNNRNFILFEDLLLHSQNPVLTLVLLPPYKFSWSRYLYYGW